MRVRRLVVALLVAAGLLVSSSATGARAAVPLSSVRVAVLDTGIRPNHPAFSSGQVVAWHDFVNTRSSAYDDQGHGTAVSSIAAGPHGWAQGAKLVVGKVLDNENKLPSWGMLADAIRWAADQQADVINVSIWGSLPNPTSAVLIGLAVDYATERDALVVWIAGNGDDLVDAGSLPGSVPSTVLPGASSPQVLVVGASNSSGTRASWSQWDPEVLAWGENVTVACGASSTCTGWSGTSFAAPRMASAAARLIADGAPRDPSWLKWVLLHSADDTAQPYPEEGYGFYGQAAHNRARAVAQGGSVPPADTRDVFHAASTAARTGQSGTVPTGLLPPA